MDVDKPQFAKLAGIEHGKKKRRRAAGGDRPRNLDETLEKVVADGEKVIATAGYGLCS